MTLSEQREAARQFANKWNGKGREDEDARSYWFEILQKIFGMDDVTDRVEFEKKVIGSDGNTKRIESKGATLVSLKENFDTHSAAGKLQMTMLAAISEFERSMILERQAEGIAIAKKKGKYKGRKRVKIPNIGDYYARYMRRELTKTAAAAELGVSRNTLTRLFEDYKRENY